MGAGLLFVNLFLVLVIAVFVLNGSKQTSAAAGLLTADTSNSSYNPLDQVSSVAIALNVAEVSNLPETTAINNQAQTALANQAMDTNSGTIITKPTIVQTALKSKANIVSYVSKPGDSATSLATKFGVTSQSIEWSNGLTSATINPGTILYIPPVNGIVYIVKAGDTPASLAATYHASEAQIIAYNDAELNGLHVGERIIIPSGTIATANLADGSGGNSDTTSSLMSSFSPTYGYNGYDYGYCTWYVATQVPVPNNWGNASSWAYYAALSGWNVDLKPTVGAIAQTPFAAGGEGHVAIVTAVNADGSQIQIKDMNGIAGWGRVGYSGWIPTSTFVHFITP